MAHGSKRWIVAHDGRVKRSRHRTHRDWLRALVRWPDWHARCAACEAERERHQPRWGYIQCTACREKDRVRDGPRGAGRWSAYGRAPAWFRRGLERQLRARVRHLMVHGRYDELPQRGRRDAAWLYW
jgi:ribosomal protein S18 acetylase RimI-like enzyme